MKHTYNYVFILCATFFCYLPVSAQETPVTHYLQQTGDHAEIYNGQLEAVYNIMLYENFPYYSNADFTDASIVYRNNYFPNQKVRLDLYREQLIVLPPEKRSGIILSSQNVQKVTMYNKTFVWFTPSKDSGLKAGYYIQLLADRKIQLFCKVSFSLQQNQLIYSFERSVRYYLLYNNRYHRVKNKGSFVKLFPQYKKQINRFAKDNSLNFKQNPDESLTSLAICCEELLTSTNK